MPGNTIALYADDCKSSRVVTCPSDYSFFYSDLDNLYLWRQQNLMDINIKKKCKLMCITKKKTPFHSDLQINNHTLQEVFEFFDLGLFTSSKLSWNTHVDKITNAKKILGLVKRTCKGLKYITTLRTLFCALVRSQLEYCTVVRSPQTARNIKNLEKNSEESQ